MALGTPTLGRTGSSYLWSLLDRYRSWLLSVLVLSGLASWFLWQDAAGRLMRERFERIQIGMTPVQVNEIVGSRTQPLDHHNWNGIIPWPVNFEAEYAHRFDCSGSAFVVYYHDGKAVGKLTFASMTPLEIKFREWHRRLGI